MTDSDTAKTGAICAALSAALFALVLYMPALGMLFFLASPLPVAYAGWRNSAKAATLVCLAAAALIALIVHPMVAVSYLTQFGLGGVLIGAGIRRDWTPERTIGGFAAVGAAAALLSAGIFSLVGEVGLPGYVEQTIAEQGELLRQMYAAQSPDPEGVQALETAIVQVKEILTRGFLGIIAGFLLFAGWFNAFALRQILMRRGQLEEIWLGWRAPEAWIWVLIVAGLALYSGREPFATLGFNVVIPMVVVYTLQGLAIVQFSFLAKNVPRLLTAVTYGILIIYMPFTIMVVAALGIFDLWVDFRRRITPPPAENGGQTK